ncbi:YiiX/YebB-like N1pC/P60 family cysteine hydrolase [Flavobacterium sp. WC2429]|uniref:YiiX/YebB-like N1pC/P60 family cysteine hydrolase n=1 Tax=Flavobacterium sp. WC2429 TaxID=3234140 RepID=A0AB39WKG4_9FLAO
MYLINIDLIQEGDIILYRSSLDISKLVRKITKSQYSHAILYVGVGSIIDSDGYGVQSNNIQRLLIEKPDDIIILRLKDKSLYNKLELVEMFARRNIGMQYSTSEAKIAALNKEVEAKEPNRQFCTRFIAQAYESAGINLVENANYCVPEEILESPLLFTIENPTREASQKEIDYAKSESPLVKQYEIHNIILNRAREISGKDIQTLEQITELIVDHPEYDDEITEFIQNTEYLYMMEKDKEDNSWRYNAEEMLEFFDNPESAIANAMFYATTESKTRERLYQTISAYKMLNRVSPRKYFEMEIELYQRLIQFSNLRETESIKVLKGR